MSIDLPYFKFTCDEWLTGNITLEKFAIQGIFINICAYYWKKDCNVTMAQLKIRYRYVKKPQWDRLIEGKYIKLLKYEQIEITFLLDLYKERIEEKNTKASAGRKGAEKRWHNHNTPINLPLAKHGNKEVEVEVEIDIEVDKDNNISRNQLIDYWQKGKNIITHKTITKDIKAAEKRVLKEYSLEELKICIRNYAEIMGLPAETYYGQYPHGFAEFFRKGTESKPPPFKKFLEEREPLKSLLMNKGQKEEML